MSCFLDRYRTQNLCKILLGVRGLVGPSRGRRQALASNYYIKALVLDLVHGVLHVFMVPSSFARRPSVFRGALQLSMASFTCWGLRPDGPLAEPRGKFLTALIISSGRMSPSAAGLTSRRDVIL